MRDFALRERIALKRFIAMGNMLKQASPNTKE
jgi:hypothetical protein